MSTATKVPETFELTGDDARETLRRIGTGRLLVDSWQRLRFADGFSHARSLAYTISLLLVQAIIGVVGLASLLGRADAHGTLVRTIEAAVPGPAGDTLTTAVRQAHVAAASGLWVGLVFGLVGSLVTGATMMGQLERGLNRLYGIEQDRPTVHKYGLALLLAVSAGLLAVFAFVCLAVGSNFLRHVTTHWVATAWAAIRWPLGLLFMAGAVSLVFRWSPRRRQPAWSWLAFAGAVSTLLWCTVTVALGAFFGTSGSFGRTYGPLAGFVALLLWAFGSAVAMLYGASIAAQLESVRAGHAEPQDEEKVEHSEPDLDRIPAGVGV